MRKIGPPAQKDFEYYLKENFIRNCPLTVFDAKRAVKIFGPEVYNLQGKSAHKQGKHVSTFNPIQVDPLILREYENDTLCVDNFYVNGNVFFHTITRAMKMRTVAAVQNRSKTVLLNELKTVLNFYESRNYDITDVHADHEFQCIREEIRPINLDVAAPDDRVHEIERSIRTVKERVRCTMHSFPFKRIPRVMCRAVVEKAVRNLNQFPAKDGIADKMSPLTIMTGKPFPDYDNLLLEFGTYVHIYEDNDPTNTTKARTTPAIALNSTGNEAGAYVVMSLVTGFRRHVH